MEKRYGLPTAIAMVVGIVIGSGVFFKAEKVLVATGGDLPTGILAWFLGGMVMVICAYNFAIMATKHEKVSGVVDYAEVALGPKYAYYVGWFMNFIYIPGLVAFLAFFSAMMFLQLFGIKAVDFANGQINPTAIGVGAMFMMLDYGVNALSPKIAGKMQVGMTVIKLIPLILMGVVGTIAGLMNGTTATTFSPDNGCTRGQIVTFLYRLDTMQTAYEYLVEMIKTKGDYDSDLDIYNVYLDDADGYTIGLVYDPIDNTVQLMHTSNAMDTIINIK